MVPTQAYNNDKHTTIDPIIVTFVCVVVIVIFVMIVVVHRVDPGLA